MPVLEWQPLDSVTSLSKMTTVICKTKYRHSLMKVNAISWTSTKGDTVQYKAKMREVMDAGKTQIWMHELTLQHIHNTV